MSRENLQSFSDSDESCNESDHSESSSSSSRAELGNSEEENMVEEPYQDEPLASDSDQDLEDGDEETDVDGLRPSTLKARFEGQINVNEWCKCQHCHGEALEDAMEFRCCHEVINAIGKLVFDGSIENIKCITQHEDFSALINPTVLMQVGPLLRYRRQTGSTQNEFLRSVAYRWLIRWLCGFMGWDNRRPLCACVYSAVRNKYPSSHKRGYKPVEDEQPGH